MHYFSCLSKLAVFCSVTFDSLCEIPRMRIHQQPLLTEFVGEFGCKLCVENDEKRNIHTHSSVMPLCTKYMQANECADHMPRFFFYLVSRNHNRHVKANVSALRYILGSISSRVFPASLEPSVFANSLFEG